MTMPMRVPSAYPFKSGETVRSYLYHNYGTLPVTSDHLQALANNLAEALDKEDHLAGIGVISPPAIHDQAVYVEKLIEFIGPRSLLAPDLATMHMIIQDERQQRNNSAQG